MERLRIAVEGIVQGVGFRPFVYGLAGRLGVGGFVANGGGEVVIEAEADRVTLDAFVDGLRTRAPGRVDRLSVTAVAAAGESAFRIAESITQTGAAAIAPDVATCADCVDEILGAGRRHDYAFTSCATCGPRLTIVTAAPYDRARTTMAGFPLCDACKAEHDDPSDRRFHAQPIACPACGPRLEMPGEDGDPIEVAATIIEAGGIVAIKGLGGYHLACDATSNNAVTELRRRKQRDAKPFAVMVASVADARALAELDAEEVALLESPARPIVLATKRVSGPLSHAIAPGVGDLGLMLPYTPLHHLLLRRLARPLVMTSGNVSDEPIAFRDEDARRRLTEIADRFLTHDRPIHMRCEDSVARVFAGAPTVLRRARGYAPAPIRLARPLARPTLALGGHLKSAFALGDGDVAFVSPHFGDLDELGAYQAFVDGIDHFCGLHRIAPQLVINDLHPDYATTRLAIQLARTRGWAQLEVQHHHAHFASALADNGLTGRAIGVVFDGAGYGDDGAIWGGEILVGDCAHAERIAHLAYVPQPGGDRAAQEPWRMAIAHLQAAGLLDGALRDRIASVAERQVDRVAQLSASGRSPQTSSVGRLFDAVAALVMPAAGNVFEGQAAMQLEALAREARDRGCYLDEDRAAQRELAVAPIIRGVVADLRRRVEPAVIARRFHTSIIELAARACESVASRESVVDVVLTGGVFQNSLLARELPARLARAGLQPHLQHRVPPNDGGLSLGQLATAAALEAGRVRTGGE